MNHKEGKIKQTSARKINESLFSVIHFFIAVGGGKDACVVWVAIKQVFNIGEVDLVTYSGTLKGLPDMAATVGIISRK